MLKKIRYICAQPAILYYTWQVEVMINNFIEMGISGNQMDVLCSIDNDLIPSDWSRLVNKYNYVRFFFYNDTRESKDYPPSIYFNLLKQHIKTHPEINDEVLFLHDCDIVFTKKPDFSLLTNDNVWYLSDTKSYLNYDYIQQKSNDIYEKMCEIIGIDKLIPKLLNNNSGGAQYIVKNTDYEFWDKVELDSVKLYKYFYLIEPQYVKKFNGDYPIQKWTAGMWGLLWNAWYFGHETIINKKMDFGWVTNDISEVDKYTILHNAGVTDENKTLFFKGLYVNELPYNKDLEIDKTKASYYYWLEVCKTGKKSCLIN